MTIPKDGYVGGKKPAKKNTSTMPCLRVTYANVMHEHEGFNPTIEDMQRFWDETAAKKGVHTPSQGILVPYEYEDELMKVLEDGYVFRDTRTIGRRGFDHGDDDVED